MGQREAEPKRRSDEREPKTAMTDNNSKFAVVPSFAVGDTYVLYIRG
jgi:hypothetical protein